MEISDTEYSARNTDDSVAQGTEIITQTEGQEALVLPVPAAPRSDTLPIAQIRPNPNNPRRLFAAAALKELTDSIRTRGVLQPILVQEIPLDETRTGDGILYEVVDGGRRFKAAGLAGLTHVPVMIGDFSGKVDTLAAALAANLHRDALTPIEEAEAYRNLNAYGKAQDQIALLVGVTQGQIAKRLGLLRLPEDVRDSIHAGRLTATHGVVLIPLMDKYHDEALDFGARAVAEKWSVDTLGEHVRGFRGDREREEREREAALQPSLLDDTPATGNVVSELMQAFSEAEKVDGTADPFPAEKAEDLPFPVEVGDMIRYGFDGIAKTNPLRVVAVSKMASLDKEGRRLYNVTATEKLVRDADGDGGTFTWSQFRLVDDRILAFTIIHAGYVVGKQINELFVVEAERAHTLVDANRRAFLETAKAVDADVAKGEQGMSKAADGGGCITFELDEEDGDNDDADFDLEADSIGLPEPDTDKAGSTRAIAPVQAERVAPTSRDARGINAPHFPITSFAGLCLTALTENYNKKNPDSPVTEEEMLEIVLCAVCEQRGIDTDELEKAAHDA